MLVVLLQAQTEFEKYFISKTLRFDYTQAGNADTSYFYFQQLKQEPFWGGSQTNLIDTFYVGKCRVMVYNFADNKLIYSRGYCTLFNEWQTIDEAKTINRSFYESVVVPFPKNKIRVVLEKRDRLNVFHQVFETIIEPADYFIDKEAPPAYKTQKIHDSGNSANNLDIVFIPDGYTVSEMQKFSNDVQKFSRQLIAAAPFNKHTDKINIWTIEAPSQESGPDIPGDSIYHKTVVGTTFYTFDSDRYLTSYDYKSVRDVAACVPYDQIVIIVNSPIYGGGGIYNFYSVFTSDNLMSAFVLTHEFGHGFASLGDEYYDSSTSYNNFYEQSVEPYQANLTTLVDFDKKWKAMLDKNTPIPTPDEKKYNNTIGVFEGGGYSAKGIFRPYINCIMKSGSAKEFCPVCQKAITDMLRFYTE